eukprot:CAMPEP_0181078256 /NCGR_PEP_ID=MMETSP1071-20121207/1387_1 /TAXON_ID=35127 /ORGANISM="Thalassiosira sp., Strain NH16" /LENGTH=229 /DNA_ID=CAMNT_0023159555 /DNA_START=317 /DNA_END=1004 /DNA_ORIENTATION=+
MLADTSTDTSPKKNKKSTISISETHWRDKTERHVTSNSRDNGQNFSRQSDEQNAESDQLLDEDDSEADQFLDEKVSPPPPQVVDQSLNKEVSPAPLDLVMKEVSPPTLETTDKRQESTHTPQDRANNEGRSDASSEDLLEDIIATGNHKVKNRVSSVNLATTTEISATADKQQPRSSKSKNHDLQVGGKKVQQNFDESSNESSEDATAPKAHKSAKDKKSGKIHTHNTH